MILGGCSLGRRPDIASVAEMQAAIKKGGTEAPIELPPLPPSCRTLIPHGTVAVGQSWYSALRREMAQLDKANDNISNCARFFDTLKHHFEER